MASKIPGLTKRGNTYWADFRIRGERVRRSLETTRKDIATERLSKLRDDARKGDWGLLDNRTPLADIVAQYLRHIQQTTESATLETYATRLNCIVSAMPRDVHLLRHHHILQYREDRLAGGLNPGTINLEVTILGSCLNWAVETQVIRSNPLKGIKSLKHKPEGARPLTEEEIDLLLKHSPERWARVWYCLSRTGLRRNEICGLGFDHIDQETHEIVVSEELAKGGKPRRLPVNKKLRGYLEDARADRNGQGTIFGLSPSSVRRALLRCCKLAGIDTDRVSCHSLRKSFCIAAFRAGGDPATVQELMGHASVEITLRIYRKVAAVDRRLVIGNLFNEGEEVSRPDHVISLTTNFPTPTKGGSTLSRSTETA